MRILHVFVAHLAWMTIVCKGAIAEIFLIEGGRKPKYSEETHIDRFRNNYVDQKIYTFAFASFKPRAFFNGKELVGSRVELMKEVCCRAGKRCDSAFVDFSRCWNSQTSLSEVLNGRWYDACVQVKTPRRNATYSFSDIPFTTLPKPAVIVAATSNITLDDLLNPRNDIKVLVHGVPNIGAVPFLPDDFKEKFFVKPENIFLIPGSANEAVDKIIEMINDPGQGSGAVAIITTSLIKPSVRFKILTQLERKFRQPTLMVRKDDQHILDWWDYSLKSFMCSPDYAKFCERVFNEFGNDPVNCPDPGEVDCSDCTIPHRVPGCPCPGSV